MDDSCTTHCRAALRRLHYLSHAELKPELSSITHFKLMRIGFIKISFSYVILPPQFDSTDSHLLGGQIAAAE